MLYIAFLYFYLCLISINIYFSNPIFKFSISSFALFFLSFLFLRFTSNSQLYLFLSFFTLLLMSAIDILYFEIPDYLQLSLFFWFYLYHEVQFWNHFLFYLFICFFTYPFIHSYIGGADLKLFIILSAFINPLDYPYIFTISSILGLSYLFFNKKFTSNSSIPFFPFISLAYIFLHYKKLILFLLLKVLNSIS